MGRWDVWTAANSRQSSCPCWRGRRTFDVVLRGYDRHQVHEHVERLEADLRIAVAERDTVAARLTELAGQLAAAHNEIDALHARLGQVTAAEPSLDDVSDRIRGMLSLAKEEAAEIRRKAEQDAVELQHRFEVLNSEVQDKLSSADRSTAERLAGAEQQAGSLLGDAERRAPSWSATPRPGPRRCSPRPSPGRRS